MLIDSDTAPNSRFRYAADALENAGFVRPTSPWMKVAGAVSTSVVLMPQGVQQGTLEQLLLDAVSSVHPVLKKCIDEFATCYKKPLTFTANQRAKMELAAAIAVHCGDDPATSLSYLWSKRPEDNPVDLKHTTFDALTNFLQTMV